MEIDLHAANLVLATVAWFARRWWRAHEFLVRAGFEEARLLASERIPRCGEAVTQRRFEPDHARV